VRAAGFLALVALGCAAPLVPVDAAPDDASHDASAPDANRRDAGFDPTTLPPCTLTTAPIDLALVPLASPVDPAAALEQRAFYVLLVLRTDAAARAALDGSAPLAAITSAREMSLRDAAATCGDESVCLRAGVAIPSTDLAPAVDATLAALEDASALTAVVAQLRASRFFEAYASGSDEALLRAAITQAIDALHAALDAYGIGELAPADLADVVAGVATAPAGSLAWWEPLARTTIAATLRAGRDEAVRYEPIDVGENEAALAAIPSIDWAAYPYAALLVPGQGPNDLETVLHPGSAIRADLAVARWRAGLAPLLAVSGGHVHPDRTPYSEAIEMKRYLMDTYDVPESAILVDPYARHTTTNLRNVTRTLLRAGVPADARVLVVTDVLQTVYIRSAGFTQRCDEELGLRPFAGLEALSPTDTCMIMAPSSLTSDARDLLDP
jgi:hypothetical protein